MGSNVASRGVPALEGLTAYLDKLPDDPMIKSVQFGFQSDALWIVTFVDAAGSLERLDPLLDAQSVARQQSPKRAIVFRIVDESIGETLDDGPQNLIPVSV